MELSMLDLPIHMVGAMTRSANRRPGVPFAAGLGEIAHAADPQGFEVA
jgi:hypothetical protein